VALGMAVFCPSTFLNFSKAYYFSRLLLNIDLVLYGSRTHLKALGKATGTDDSLNQAVKSIITISSEY